MPGEFKLDGLEKWQRWLTRLDHEEVPKTKDRILRKSALQLQTYLDDLTPERTGDLRNSWKTGDPNNVFELKVGKTSYVVVGTALAYARYVNDGFTQQAGRFVPGFWSSGTFHYVPGFDSGMVLTGKIIPGAHMFEKSEAYLKEDMPEILDTEFRRLYQLLFQS